MNVDHKKIHWSIRSLPKYKCVKLQEVDVPTYDLSNVGVSICENLIWPEISECCRSPCGFFGSNVFYSLRSYRSFSDRHSSHDPHRPCSHIVPFCILAFMIIISIVVFYNRDGYYNSHNLMWITSCKWLHMEHIVWLVLYKYREIVSYA